MKNLAISVTNVSKTFSFRQWSITHSESELREIKSIDNISLDVEKGKMVGIIGKNGSGKTTLLRLVAGVLKPDQGNITTKGAIGPLLQIGLGGNEEFTVKENIITYGMLLGFSKNLMKSKVSEILKYAELEEYINVKMKYLSSGMKVRIMFSTALLMDPDILLVDEVIAVGDASFRKKSFDSFLSFKNKGSTILFVSHNLQQVKQLCDHVYFLDKGKIIEHGDPEKIVTIYENFCKAVTKEPRKSKSVEKNVRKYQIFEDGQIGDSPSHEKIKKMGIPEKLNGKQVLDIGCNEGFYCFECEKKGAKVVGIEFNKVWYDLALERKNELSSSVDFFHMNWNEIQKLNYRFDLVLFLAAFHYLRDNQLDLLKKIFEKMNSGGLLILELGISKKNEDAFLIETIKRPGGDICQYPNKFSIEKLLKDAGFSESKIFGKSFDIKGDPVPRYIVHAKK